MGGERERRITRKTGRQILFCLLGKPASRLMGSERREKVRGGRGRETCSTRARGRRGIEERRVERTGAKNRGGGEEQTRAKELTSKKGGVTWPRAARVVEDTTIDPLRRVKKKSGKKPPRGHRSIEVEKRETSKRKTVLSQNTEQGRGNL